MQICSRWVSLRKLRGRALWLAFGSLRNLHREYPRVVFRPAHAFNFAFEALQLGYPAEAVVRAWRIGVAESHDDSLDRDRLPGGEFAAPREPSAAKVYAIRELRASDSLTWRERWAAFFARPWTRSEKPDKKPRRAKSGAAPAGAGSSMADAPVPRFTPAEKAAKLAELRARIAQPRRLDNGEAPAVTAGQVKAYLDARGIRLADFQQLPWSDRQRIISRVRAELDK